MFNFWLVAIAFLTAAYVNALNDKHPQVALVVAVSGAVISFCFRRLEIRTRQLVRLGEDAIEHFQRKMADATGIREMEIVKTAEAKKGKFASYGIVLRWMQWLVIIAFLGGMSYAAWDWTQLY
jgi:hypothetical protein